MEALPPPEGLLLLLLLLQPGRVAGDEVEAERAPLAFKCCAADQQLNDYLNTCVPRPLPAGQPPPPPPPSPETSVAGAGGGFPWWMDPNLTVYDPTTLEAVRPAGAAWAWEEAGRRPCEYARAQMVSTRRLDSFRLLANGSLLLAVWRTAAGAHARHRVEVALAPGEWCADRAGKRNTAVLQACPCARVACVNRCCGASTLFRAEMGTTKILAKCASRTGVPAASANDTLPAFFRGQEPDPEPVTYTELNSHHPECNASLYAKHLLRSEGGASGRWWLQRNGSALIEGYGRGSAFPGHHFCLAEVAEGAGQPPRQDLFFCQARRLAAPPTQENVYYSALFTSGALFLVATLLTHALLPELRRSAHAKALMCHCGALAVAFAALSSGHVLRVATEPFCSASAFMVQYFFLTTFFWLNVMCFDLAWTFGRLSAQPPSAEGQRRRFLWYSLYAWGSPALITAVTLVMQYAAPQHLPLLPHIGARRCWIDTKMAELLYYYLPVLLLLLADVALFAFTVIRIKREHRHTALLRRDSSSQATRGGHASQDKGPQRRMLRVLTRLFCVMGVSWLTEVIAWTVDSQVFPFWYVTDPINFLRGLLIFVFFCWKPLRVRWQRWRRRRRREAAGGGGGTAGAGAGAGAAPSAGVGGSGAESSEERRCSSDATSSSALTMSVWRRGS